MALAPKILGTDSLRQAYPKLNGMVDMVNGFQSQVTQIKGYTANTVNLTWAIGSVSSSSGGVTQVDNRIYSERFIINNHTIDIDDSLKLLVAYYNADNTFNSSTGFLSVTSYKLDKTKSQARIVLSRKDESKIINPGDLNGLYSVNIPILSESNVASLAKIPAIEESEQATRELLKLGLSNIQINAELGTVSSTTGGMSDALNRVRFGKLKINNHFLEFKNDKYEFIVVYYNENGTFNSSTGNFQAKKFFIFDNTKYECRVVIRKKDNSNFSSAGEINGEVLLYQSPSSSSSMKSQFSLSSQKPGRFDVNSYYWSDSCIVNGQYWAFRESDADQSFDPINSIGCIYVFDESFNIVNRILHNFGHVNSLEYSSENDCLIFGNGSGDSSLQGEFYVLQGVKHWATLPYDTMLNLQGTISGTKITKYPVGMALGWKLNVVWGDDNYGQCNIAYALTNNGERISKLLLGKGSNQFSEGIFESGLSANQYNGTYKVVKEWAVPPSDVVQGACYFNGSLYVGCGHDGIWVIKYTLNPDGTYVKFEKKEIQYRADGTLYPYNATEGVTVYDGFIYSTTFGSSGARFIHKYRAF